MRVRILPGTAQGTVAVPASKSVAHRQLICAGMSQGVSVIHGVSACEDVRATVDCLRAVGVRFRRNGDRVEVTGTDFRTARADEILRCRESGSTLRFLIPPLLLTGYPAVFEGYGRLMERPMQIYESLCRERGLMFRQEEQRIAVCGRLPSGRYELPGNVSSQFISGLLFALPLADGDSEVILTTPPESRSYLLLTLDAMRCFGVEAFWEGDCCLRIPGGQSYRASTVTVEGDYSNAAFLDAFNFLGGAVTLTGLRADSMQGDRYYREAMQALCQEKAEFSLRDCPDLGPVLFAVAAAKHGGVFTGTRRLRIKESDRVSAMQEELAALGATVRAEEDWAEVLPGALHAPSRVLNGHNDHRIVMALSLLLTLTGGVIDGAEAVRKSYPAFFDDLRRLGIQVQELDE